jgi:predicted nucleic acid-binding protein
VIFLNKHRKHKSKKPNLKKILTDNHTRKWYYDACALEGEKVYDEMYTNTKFKIYPLVSHLSFGEAYGNVLDKGKKQISDFNRLISTVKEHCGLKVVGNDGIKSIYNKIQEINSRLSLTDSIHLATAIKNKCEIFKTRDGDLTNLSYVCKNKFAKFAKSKGCTNFNIQKV